MLALLALGVDGLMTDRPDILAEVLAADNTTHQSTNLNNSSQPERIPIRTYLLCRKACTEI